LAKPEGMSDANFTELKKQTLAMAHGSLALVQVHKNELEAAIPELEQAVALASNEDPTNYYVLGVANQNAGHFEKAAVAFEKCAAVKSNLQGPCTTGAEQSKKRPLNDRRSKDSKDWGSCALAELCYNRRHLSHTDARRP